MTLSAAATLHHNREKVENWGIKIIDDSDIDSYAGAEQFSRIDLGDLEMDRLRGIVEGFGVPFELDIIGICAQDHGVPPAGHSHLDYRHSLFKERLDKNPFPHALIYKKGEVPPTLNRLSTISESAASLPVNEIYVMDSGMAAILGASMDRLALDKENIIILDVATSHTVGAALAVGEIAGTFEYHTHDITVERLDALVVDLADGNLAHEKILSEGGHGAYLRKSFGYDAAEAIIATGPKRRLLRHSTLPIHFGAPWGDNMMTGTVGLLEAIRRRKGMESLAYL
jgi:uncharacterized protein (DUF1786 family)